MIIVNLKGGLGNQMFQYALGRKLALQNNDVLKLDVSGLDRANEVGDIYRPFYLGEFNITAAIASSEETRVLKYPYGLLSKALRRFRFKVLRQMHTGWEPEVLKKKGDIYLDGFWQSPKYFEDIRSTLLKDFSLKDSSSVSGQQYADMVQECSAVSIHVRRGDYASNQKVSKAYGACSLEYYKKAIAKISSKVIDPAFFVFSDDVVWAKEHLNTGDIAVYVSADDMTDAEEMILMSKCKHNIIANSSFSWWGAWLNQNKEKIIVAPKPWFEKNEKQFKHLIPETWIRIEKK